MDLNLIRNLRECSGNPMPGHSTWTGPAPETWFPVNGAPSGFLGRSWSSRAHSAFIRLVFVTETYGFVEHPHGVTSAIGAIGVW